MLVSPFGERAHSWFDLRFGDDTHKQIDGVLGAPRICFPIFQIVEAIHNTCCKKPRVCIAFARWKLNLLTSQTFGQVSHQTISNFFRSWWMLLKKIKKDGTSPRVFAAILKYESDSAFQSGSSPGIWNRCRFRQTTDLFKKAGRKSIQEPRNSVKVSVERAPLQPNLFTDRSGRQRGYTVLRNAITRCLNKFSFGFVAFSRFDDENARILVHLSSLFQTHFERKNFPLLTLYRANIAAGSLLCDAEFAFTNASPVHLRRAKP